jgi:hypothetical protein
MSHDKAAYCAVAGQAAGNWPNFANLSPTEPLIEAPSFGGLLAWQGVGTAIHGATSRGNGCRVGGCAVVQRL